MKRTLAGVLLAVPVWVLGQDPSNSLLWSISGQGLTAPSYVYGTVHSKDERAYTFSHAVEEAMRGVNSVAGELDFKSDTRSSLALMSLMMMPDGQHLEDLYSKKHWKEVDAALRERLGPMAGMVMRMKPFFVMAMLADASMGNDRPEVLDAYLMDVARDSGKKVFGLETVKEQFAAIDALPVKEQAQALRAHLRMDSSKELDELLDAYAKQDLEVLMKLMSDSPSMPSALQKSLIVDRNQVMAHRMDSVLVADGPSFFMVGAGHLPASTGVIELLRTRGYQLEPVPMSRLEHVELHAPSEHIDGWIHYVNDTLGFSVDMPKAPKLTVSTSFVEFVANAQQRSVMVAVQDLSEEKQSMTLNELAEKEFSGIPGALVENRLQHGRPARLETVSFDEYSVFTLLIPRGDRAFSLVVISSEELTAQFVLDSFRLLDKPE